MKKSLYLIRHARTEEKLPDQRDFDRPLTAIGLQNSSRMGRNFYQKDIRPDVIISSPAVRASTTARLIAEQINFDSGRIKFEEEIYNASTRTLFELVTNLDDSWQEVFLIGHNPVVSYVAEYLTGDDIGSLATCGVVKINFEVKKWIEVTAGSGTIIFYEYPELLNF